MESEKYLARIEPIAQQPNGDIEEDGGYLVDAVPRAELERRGSSNERVAEREPMPFLALITRESLRGVRTESGWVQISVSANPSEGDAIPAEMAFSTQNAGDGPERFSVSVEEGEPPESLVQVIEQAATFEQTADASIGEIREVFEKVCRHADAGDVGIAVYDVGQASMSAVVDCYEHPLMFFDMGWPLWFNAKSNPLNKDFDPLHDFAKKPAPVVLSHLDWDHWGYTIEKGLAKKDKATGAWITEPTYRVRALNRAWLLTRPEVARHGLGPSHLHFVRTLEVLKGVGDSKLLFWPHRKKSLSIGSLHIIRNVPAIGLSKPSFLRNNESLSICVRAGGANALLCGDADYPSIPERFRESLCALVAPHHGGRITPGTTPYAVGHGRMVVSAFGGCYRSIPCGDSMDEAFEHGWRTARTDDRYSCSRCHEIHGNRLVRLLSTPKCGCGGVDRSGLCVSRD